MLLNLSSCGQSRAAPCHCPHSVSCAMCSYRAQVQVSTIQCGSRCRKLVQQPVCRLQRSQPPRLAAAVHSSRHYCSASVRQLIAATPCSLAAGTGRRRCGRTAALPPLAMINVDFASPSLVLGIALIGCGVALLQVDISCRCSCTVMRSKPSTPCCTDSNKQCRYY